MISMIIYWQRQANSAMTTHMIPKTMMNSARWSIPAGYIAIGAGIKNVKQRLRKIPKQLFGAFPWTKIFLLVSASIAVKIQSKKLIIQKHTDDR